MNGGVEVPDLLRVEDLGTFFGVLLFGCAAIVTLWAAVKVAREIGQPAKDRNKKLEELETRADENKARIDELSESTKILLQSQTVVIEHLISNDHQEQLVKMNEKIHDYLWHTWGDV